MDDEKLVEQVARDIVDEHGSEAVPILRERAEAAEISSDELAAKTWRDITDAGERLLEKMMIAAETTRAVEVRITKVEFADLLTPCYLARSQRDVPARVVFT